MSRFDFKSEEKETLLKEKIQEVLDGNTNELSIKNINASTLDSILESLNCENCDDHEFNGWDCDYWYSFIYKEEVFRVFGGAWYGSATISREVD